jgi:hypothetical protein
MKPPKAKAERVCSICGTCQGDMTSYLDGHVCETCCDITREGRDGTTQALKQKQTADRLQVEQIQGQTGHQSAEAVEYTIAAGQLMAGELLGATTAVQIGSGGEVIKPQAAGMINTLSQPSIAAVDASNHRTDLLTMLGSDIAAMALDAADTIEAGNSLEKMLAHQMAAIHHASMQMVYRANLIQDPALAAKTLNAAMKGFNAYQGGIGALRQLRGNQQQHIVVQHVNVSAGGQAMVGAVNTRGGRS